MQKFDIFDVENFQAGLLSNQKFSVQFIDVKKK